FQRTLSHSDVRSQCSPKHISFVLASILAASSIYGVAASTEQFLRMPFSTHSFTARLRLRAQPKSSPRVINRMRAAFDPAFDEVANKPVNPIAPFCKKVLRSILIRSILILDSARVAQTVQFALFP